MADSTAQSQAKVNAHGLDKALWKKIDGKFDPVRAHRVMRWISQVVDQPDVADQEFGPALKDGYLISLLVQQIDPDIKDKIKKRKWKPKQTNAPFKAREQIELFGKACRALGMKNTDCFTSQDLFEQENLNQVVSTLYSLASIASKLPGYEGPLIEDGYVSSTENKRVFTEEQLRKNANAIPFASRGALKMEAGPQLDGYGINKTAGNENYKASSEVPKWSQGSIQHESDRRLDSYGINKTAGNENYKASSEVPKWSQGSIQHESDRRLDSAGVIKTAGSENFHTSSAVPKWNQGSIAHNSDKQQDSVGIVRMPKN